MAALPSELGSMDSQNQVQNESLDRLKALYPNVNEEETPLPRAWSTKDKYTYIGLSQNNLRVHYKGHGKTHKDAASVRATHPIPAACGLYYFEVRIVSKGRDGYMGIGLSAHGVNMNRLPGWDKHSYGYHGDDGHSFCSSGTGQPYGPTFTTGDVIGCGVNLVDNTCFYTKNGHHLGIAFRGLPANLYPTVGLQTPGEVVDANFGQQPFVFDVEDMLCELRARTRLAIHDYALPDSQGQWQAVLHRMVSTYLVHHGYCSTAEAFTRATGQTFDEDMASIKNRQRILKLVLAGRMGEAIEHTRRLYPGLLEKDQNLLFMLKCRQFVEMVNGSDSEMCTSDSQDNGGRPMSPIQMSVILHTNSTSPTHNGSAKSHHIKQTNGTADGDSVRADVGLNGSEEHGTPAEDGSDVDMECATTTTNDGEMSSRQVCGGSRASVERMLEFGRELYTMSQRLPQDAQHKTMLEDAFSLLAYSNPWASPVGWQLCPSRREPVCAALNSAILESQKMPWRAPLEACLAHASALLARMAAHGLGACAFADLAALLRH